MKFPGCKLSSLKPLEDYHDGLMFYFFIFYFFNMPKSKRKHDKDSEAFIGVPAESRTGDAHSLTLTSKRDTENRE